MRRVRRSRVSVLSSRVFPHWAQKAQGNLIHWIIQSIAQIVACSGKWFLYWYAAAHGQVGEPPYCTLLLDEMRVLQRSVTLGSRSLRQILKERRRAGNGFHQR